MQRSNGRKYSANSRINRLAPGSAGTNPRPIYYQDEPAPETTASQVVRSFH